MDLTTYSRQAFGEMMQGTALTLPSSWWVGLATLDTDGNPEEPVDSDYQRQEVARSLTAWAGTQGPGTVLASTGITHKTSNNAEINFGPSAFAWAPTHVVIFDDEVGGNCWFSIEIAGLNVDSEMPVSFAAGTLEIVFGLSSGTSDYLSNKLIDLVFRAQGYTWPATVYAAYTTTMPTNSVAGTEPSIGTGYARTALASTTGVFSLTDGVVSNIAEVAFNPPLLDQGNVVGQMLMDDSGVANVLFFGPLTGYPYTVQGGGASPRYPAGQLQFFFA